MLNFIHLKSPSSPGQPPLGFPLKPSITIFVGPNNSGKSLVLREITNLCANGSRGDHTLILKNIEFDHVDEKVARADYQAMRRLANPGEKIQEGFSPVVFQGRDDMMNDNVYFLGRTQPNQHTSFFASFYLKPLTLSLDGATRIALLNDAPRGDLKKPGNPLARIFTDDAKREEWRKAIHDAFELYPGIDATVGSDLSIRFGLTPPPRERTLEEDIINWMRQARPLGSVSDGVKAFSGILLQLIAGDPRIIVVDEPEAFLHPSLARTLGKALATAAHSEGKYVFASTHSSEFLMGAIQSGAVVNIVRLTFGNGNATARLLPNEELVTMMNDPMLRSVGVLSGLFFNNVIVSEGDSDRAFYQEINERLVAKDDVRGISHALFLNADNKDTIPAILSPLRKLGIPAAGIFDLDVVIEGGGKWTRLIESIGLPEGQHQASHTTRQYLFERLTEAAPTGTPKKEKYFKRNGGVSLLLNDDQEAADNFCGDLARYGMFIVQGGEVESWLESLSLPSKEAGWRAAIFSAMGSDPKKQPYVEPADGDVWDFIGHIGEWMENPNRRGIPT